MVRKSLFFAAVCAMVSGVPGPGATQDRWWDNAFGSRPSWDRGNGGQYGGLWDERAPDWRGWDGRGPAMQGGDVRDGGARPAIVPIAPPVVPFPYAYPANSIVIDSGGKRLYYVLPGQQAYAYEISVGREGFDWTGTETISRKQEWPDWHPPAEMRQRDPSLPVKMTGGLRNPLGAMALYLGSTLYRIHGTNDERSLGQAASSGCFRMMNASVMHLAGITEVGTPVHVIAALAPPRVVGDARAAPPVAPAWQDPRWDAYRPGWRTGTDVPYVPRPEPYSRWR